MLSPAEMSPAGFTRQVMVLDNVDFEKEHKYLCITYYCTEVTKLEYRLATRIKVDRSPSLVRLCQSLGNESSLERVIGRGGNRFESSAQLKSSSSVGMDGTYQYRLDSSLRTRASRG